MKTEILKIKGDWQEVLDDCRSTVGKEGLGREPSPEFKKALLIAEHGPIRDIIFKWKWRKMPHWVSVHWVRHKWEKFIETLRSDRTGTPRDKLPQDTPVDFTGEANTQHLIDTWRKRLCRQASPETRAYAEDFKMRVHKIEPEISDVLCPNCVYRAGCPEMNKCGYWEYLVKESAGKIQCFDIQKRYDAYNEIFWRNK